MKFKCPLCGEIKEDNFEKWFVMILSLAALSYNKNHVCESCIKAKQIKWRNERNQILK